MLEAHQSPCPVKETLNCAVYRTMEPITGFRRAQSPAGLRPHSAFQPHQLHGSVYQNHQPGGNQVYSASPPNGHGFNFGESILPSLTLLQLWTFLGHLLHCPTTGSGLSTQRSVEVANDWDISLTDNMVTWSSRDHVSYAARQTHVRVEASHLSIVLSPHFMWFPSSSVRIETVRVIGLD